MCTWMTRPTYNAPTGTYRERRRALGLCPLLPGSLETPRAPRGAHRCSVAHTFQRGVGQNREILGAPHLFAAKLALSPSPARGPGLVQVPRGDPGQFTVQGPEGLVEASRALFSSTLARVISRVSSGGTWPLISRLGTSLKTEIVDAHILGASFRVRAVRYAVARSTDAFLQRRL